MAQEAKSPGANTGMNYIYIYQGEFRQSVDKENPLAKPRKYSIGKGEDAEEKVKFEIFYPSIVGFIKSIESRETKWKTNQVQILVEDSSGDQYTIQMEIESYNYAKMFLEKAPNIDFEKEVLLRPYNKFTTSEGKTVNEGISLLQDPIETENGIKYNTKISSFYWDTNGRCNGFPEPGEDSKTYKKKDWVYYFSNCDDFLLESIDSVIKEKIDKAKLPF